MVGVFIIACSSLLAIARISSSVGNGFSGKDEGSGVYSDFWSYIRACSLTLHSLLFHTV
jgi:hypothetical protein